MSASSFVIRASPIAGKGAFATRRIPKGERIIEYKGERISQREADDRYPDTPGVAHHTFLFTLDDDTVVDAAVGGNKARFINHSCDPNCEAVIDSGHIYIETTRTIQPGQELVYDYQYERAPDADESDEARYPCRCGAPNCRGTILAPPKRKRAAASAKRGKGATKRKKAAKKGVKKSVSGKKTSSTRGKSAAKRGTAASKRGTVASKRAAKSPTRSKVSPNRLKAAAKRRRSA
jgi:hypothetical protein